ncbi:MAG: Translation initiation factor IF-2, partial [Microgenomates bacterium 39_6]
IKNKLTQFGIVTEDRGGDIVLVPVSAKTGEGVDELLEMILLLSQMSELDYYPQKPFQGVVLESGLDAKKGMLVTAIVKQGKLSVGQKLVTGQEEIKVRALFDDSGQPIKEALVSQPVSILGFTKPLAAGSLIFDSSFGMEKLDNSSLKETFGGQKERALLKLVIKADTQGTLEALINSIPQKKTSIIKSGVGDINDSDVFLASSAGAEIIGFNVSLSRRVADLAEAEKVNVQTEEIIYELLQSIEEKLRALEIIEEEKKILGQAEIIADFTVPDGRVAGARVISGEIEKGTEVVIVNPKGKNKKTKIISLQQGSKKIDRAKEGQEFGAIFSPVVDFKVGDMIKYQQF